MGAYLHEQVHVAVFNQYNISSHVYYLRYFPDVSTVPDKNCPTETCILSNSINEAVHYNTTPILIILIIGLMFIIILLELNLEAQNHE